MQERINSKSKIVFQIIFLSTFLTPTISEYTTIKNLTIFLEVAKNFSKIYLGNYQMRKALTTINLVNLGSLCKTSSFARFLYLCVARRQVCQTQILILKTLNVFLRLKFSLFLTLNKIEHFSKVSLVVFVVGVITCCKEQS